ncbi:MAG TPA: hypothetical protein VEB59_04205, partial [Gemmatimonadales bacterium]|nr:hypothetical protein [Gemmatimonadales bacterium]
RWGRPETDRPIALDGRMLPHEWLRGPRGHLKVDALDHHDDHFFPGPRDIAWDLAGTCVEFGLDDSVASELIGRYRRLSRDHTIEARLPAHALAYLAFRTGYAAMSAESLRGSPDGERFRTLTEAYRSRLRGELARAGAARWSA